MTAPIRTAHNTIMFALFYHDPDTGQHLACTSTSKMTFEDGSAPVLFATSSSLKAIFDCYAKHRGMSEDPKDHAKLRDRKTGTETPLVNDRARFKIVPVTLQYLFVSAEAA